MRLSQRLIASAVLIALSGALGGCSTGFGGWDPTDLLDIFDSKKKLPGERKPVFPDGVPGLEQGVPKQLYKGAQADQQDTQAVAVAAPEEPKTKGGTKSKGTKPAAQDAAAAPGPNAAGEDGGADAAPPAPKAKKVARRRTTAPPPDQSAAQPDPPAQTAQTPQQSAAPFPAPLPGGTFTR